MNQLSYTFHGKQVAYYLDANLEQLHELVDQQRCILLVDEQVSRLHSAKLGGWRKILIPSGEESKDLRMLEHVTDALVDLEADRKTMLIGIGGGVVTDLTGFVASVYMRGVPFGFVPSTLLAQVDASIGGKNGINYGSFKNLLGIIRQPDFILFDYALLYSLPEDQWRGGFAEVIKSACIADGSLFELLEHHCEDALQRDPELVATLVQRCVEIKSRVVEIDEFETNERRWLNFGHTLGHAVEKIEHIPHGQAVAIGMVAASKLSSRLSGLSATDVKRITQLIEAYGLPTRLQSEASAISQLFRMDKKRERDRVNFVLLPRIGEARVEPILLDELEALLPSLY